MLRTLFLCGLVLSVAASRLIDHPFNFTPVLMMAFFAGVKFSDKRWAFAVPVVAMLLSDIVLHMTTAWDAFTAVKIAVYGCVLVCVIWGQAVRGKLSVTHTAGAALGSGLLFFVVTNLAVWAFGSMYPHSFLGLTECYVAAVPFFKSTLLGNCVFATVMFSVSHIAEFQIPRLRERLPVSV